MFTSANAHPTTVILLLAGVVTFFGLMGLGRLTCRSLRVDVSGPWDTTFWALTGMLVASLIIETAAIASQPTRSFWATTWGMIAAVGVCQLIDRVRIFCAKDHQAWIREPFTLIAVAASVVTLLIALAPSSKFDELYYHMLTPQRVLTDGGLHFYRFPWQSAILPQMHYQLSQTPLHAIGLPDAANVVSWCFSVLLQIFVARIVIASGRSVRLGAFAAACVSVGMIPAVWHVTAGAHAVGHLASAALLIFIAHPDSKGTDSNPRRPIIIASLFALAAVSTKLTLLPLSGAPLLWLIIRESRSAARPVRKLIQLSSISAAIWLVFYTPLAALTAYHSGSPFAIVLSGSTGTSAYTADEAKLILSQTKAINQSDLPTFLFQSGVGHSPLLWLAALALLIGAATAELRRYWAAMSVIALLTVTVITQNDLRFLAGYPSAAIAILLSQSNPRMLDWLENSSRAAIVLFGLIPWLLGMTWYALPFAECSLGIQTRESFLEQYTALRRDFLALNDLLPRDAVLLVTTGRINSVSAPRPVLYDVRDLPPDRPVFVLTVNQPAPEIAGATIGDAVYGNDSAVIAAYRRPGARPRIGVLQVFALSRRDR